MSEATPQELAARATQKGTFSFADALKGRSHPTEEVSVWLDEATAYPLLENDIALSEVKAQLRDYEVRRELAGGSLIDVEAAEYTALIEKRDELDSQRKDIAEALAPSRFVFTVQGIDVGVKEDLLAQAVAEYPYEYDEYTNMITGQKVRDEKVSPQRNRLYTNLLWQAHIVKITDPDGNEDFLPALETIAATRRGIPAAGVDELSNAMDKVDMAVDWFRAIADESFLAKP